MEKTLTIDGKPVRFKATAATLLRYKAQTGREFLTDCAAMAKTVQGNTAELNLEMIYAVAWAMAKTAEKSTPDLMSWLDGFEEFPIMETVSELLPMLTALMRVDPKNG